jgi:hypothetical protein
MLTTLFPKQIGNSFPGHVAALWIFGLMLVLRLLISVNSMAMPRKIAEEADGIPLSQFPAGAAAEMVSLFSLLGLLTFSLTAIGVLALWRYRAMVPMLFGLFLLERVARGLLLRINPGVPRLDHPSGKVVTAVLLVMMIVGFLLCFWKTFGLRSHRA